MTRYREEIEAKPEADPLECAGCGDEPVTATPEGPMCRECADELAEAMDR